VAERKIIRGVDDEGDRFILKPEGIGNKALGLIISIGV
jgi:hypothetical protein